MTGRSSSGKISMRVRNKARIEVRASATTMTITEIGRLSAARMSHMSLVLLVQNSCLMVALAAQEMGRDRRERQQHQPGHARRLVAPPRRRLQPGSEDFPTLRLRRLCSEQFVLLPPTALAPAELVRKGRLMSADTGPAPLGRWLPELFSVLLGRRNRTQEMSLARPLPNSSYLAQAHSYLPERVHSVRCRYRGQRARLAC